MFCHKSTDVSIEEVRCFCFPEKICHDLNVVFHKPCQGDRPHVRIHIINKVLLHLGDMEVPLWVEILKFGVIDTDPCALARGYLIFSNHKGNGKGWIPSEASSPDLGCSEKFYWTSICFCLYMEMYGLLPLHSAVFPYLRAPLKRYALHQTSKTIDI